ncbi:tyrosine-type recombinase/integrase [Natronosporangium hydrolyticum]|nr:tyrosine-type recombinase/integrase [Natronosporangium hydrolyticum]
MLAVLPRRADSPSPKALRQALRGWVFNVRRRGEAETPPADWTRELAWLERHAPGVDVFDDTGAARRILDSLTVKLDGGAAGATTVARRRAVFFGYLQYGVELGYFTSNPLQRFTWQPPAKDEAVDRRVVVNHDQARALLTAVALTYPPLVAFFGCMYYAAMRPAEVIALRETDLVPPREGELAELVLNGSNPAVAAGWTDSGRRGKRQLKHRSVKTTRVVPCVPELWELLRAHLETFGVAPDGRLFRGTRGGPVPDSVYSRVWEQARGLALSPAEVASPLAGRPYDLRHAAVSSWLNAGVDPTQVAEWAGNSVNVLLRVYARCVVGRDRVARRRIAEALRPDVES